MCFLLFRQNSLTIFPRISWRAINTVQSHAIPFLFGFYKKVRSRWWIVKRESIKAEQKNVSRRGKKKKKKMIRSIKKDPRAGNRAYQMANTA